MGRRVSDGIDSPDTRFTKTAHPYMLPDGTKIAEDFSDLTDGSILHSIDIDTTGEPVGLKFFWTGTNNDGTTAALVLTCNGWTADPLTNFRGMAESTKLSSYWWSDRWGTDRSGGHPCQYKDNLVCFQQ